MSIHEGIVGHVPPFDTVDVDTDDMCPNRQTPWRCNGPHLTDQTPYALRGRATHDDLARVGAAVERLMERSVGGIDWDAGIVSVWAGIDMTDDPVEGTGPTLIEAITAALEGRP